MLVPFLLTLSSKENEAYSRLRVFTFFTGLIIIIFSETTIRLISETTMKNFTISLMPFFLLITLYLILLKKNNFNHLLK
jgi:lipopolysaccharide export system permease protein